MRPQSLSLYLPKFQEDASLPHCSKISHSVQKRRGLILWFVAGNSSRRPRALIHTHKSMEHGEQQRFKARMPLACGTGAALMCLLLLVCCLTSS